MQVFCNFASDYVLISQLKKELSMSEFAQTVEGNRYDFLRHIQDWMLVSKIYEHSLPEMTEAFAGPADLDDLSDKGLRVAAALKAAVCATFEAASPGTYSKPILHIESAVRPEVKTVPNFFVDLQELRNGVTEPFPVKLIGNALNPVIQTVGRMVGSEILRGQTAPWGISVESGGDHTPYIRASFKPRASLSELSLFACYRDVNAGGILEPSPFVLVGGQELLKEEVDPEVVEATLAFAGAVTQWITNPDCGAIRTLHRAKRGAT